MPPRRATQADVAREAGVSVATVSYVASGRRDRKKAATPEITERVLAAMAKLDYTPTRAGRVLARSRTGLIAIATSTAFNPRVTRTITQIEEVAAEHDLGVVILHYGHTPDAVERVETHLIEGLADAAIVLGAVSFGSSRLYRIGRKVPLLAIGEFYRPRGFDVMLQNEKLAVRSAAEHLVQLGVQRPAFVGEGNPPAGHDLRREAFEEVFREHGYPESVLSVRQGHEDAFSGFFDAQHFAVELLSRPKRTRPDAVIAGSDRAAISTLWAATQLGIPVPDALKVIGVGNIPEGARLQPALTTVGNDVADYRPVLERLIRRIDDPDMKTQTLTVPWRLIRRDTA